MVINEINEYSTLKKYYKRVPIMNKIISTPSVFTVQLANNSSDHVELSSQPVSAVNFCPSPTYCNNYHINFVRG